MTSSSFLCPSFLKIPTSKNPSCITPSPKIQSLDNPFPRIKIPPRNCTPLVSLQPIKSSPDSTVVVEEGNPRAESSSHSGNDSVLDEEDRKAAEAQSKIGARVRVKGPLKVYHVPKVPEFELSGKIGVLKQYVAVHKGKKISANFPYKVELVAENIEGRNGPVKFFAHLREDEFEYLD